MTRLAFPVEAYQEAERHHLGQPRSCYRGEIGKLIPGIILFLGLTFLIWFLWLPAFLHGQGGWMREGMVILTTLLFPLVSFPIILQHATDTEPVADADTGGVCWVQCVCLLLGLLVSCVVGGQGLVVWLIADWTVLFLVATCIFSLVEEIKGTGDRAYGCIEGFLLLKKKGLVKAVGRWDQVVELNYCEIGGGAIKSYQVVLATYQAVDLSGVVVRGLWEEAQCEFLRLHPHHLAGQEREDNKDDGGYRITHYWRVEE